MKLRGNASKTPNKVLQDSKQEQTRKFADMRADTRQCTTCKQLRHYSLFGSILNYYEGNSDKHMCSYCYDIGAKTIPTMSHQRHEERISTQQDQIMTLLSEQVTANKATADALAKLAIACVEIQRLRGINAYLGREYNILHNDYIDAVRYSERLEARIDNGNSDSICDKYLA